MAKLLTGKEVVAHIAENLQGRISKLAEQNTVPTLAFVRMGQRSDDISYERTATKRAEGLGIATRPYELDADASQEALAEVLQSINDDAGIHGCLMFRPLPKHIDEQAACDLLATSKDIDGISMAALASVFAGTNKGFPPSTAAACLEMLDFYQVPITGKHVVVVGRSLVIGKPVSMLLLERNASVTMCHSKTNDLPAMVRQADIVICATGRARSFGAEYFSAGQTVLDVGINFDNDGKLCGDVDFDAVEPIVGAITPVPGGIGSVTTSVTMQHVVAAAEAQVAARS